MHFTQRNLHEDITYWPPSSGQTNDFGHALLGGPVLLKGRWEQKSQQVRKNNGDEFTSAAEVLLSADVETSGYLIQGDFTTTNAVPTREAWEIQEFRKTSDLRNLGYDRRAFL